MTMDKINDILSVCERTDRTVEIFYFFDPFCDDCYDLEPLINKLSIEYKDHIVLRKILSPSLRVLTKCQAQSSGDNDNIALAYKAAEIQGQSKARSFLRYIQNRLAPTRSICTTDIIINSAMLAGLDLDLFLEDMQSENVRTLLKRDLAVYREMNIEEDPSFVFFSGDIHTAGIKIEGGHPYYIFTHIINELLPFDVEKRPLPTIYEYIEKFEVVSFFELQTVYGWRQGLLLQELNKMKLQRLITAEETDYGIFYQLYGRKSAIVL